MGGWLGSSGGPGAWGAKWGADAGGEGGRASGGGGAAAGGDLGDGLAGEGGAAGGGRLKPGGCRGSGGGGGAGRRGAHREVGEVASEVGGAGREGQLPAGGWSAGGARSQSSMKIGFTNHRRPFPMDSSISHEQFSGWAVDLRLEAGGAPGAGSLGASAGLPPPRRGFSEESQKPVREERGRGGQSPKPGPCVERTRWCLRAALGQGRGRARRRGVCFTRLKVVFPSWTVLNLSHHFLPREGEAPRRPPLRCQCRGGARTVLATGSAPRSCPLACDSRQRGTHDLGCRDVWTWSGRSPELPLLTSRGL